MDYIIDFVDIVDKIEKVKIALNLKISSRLFFCGNFLSTLLRK